MTITDKKADPPKAVELAPAAASGDPAIQQLLAERQTAWMNKDDAAAAALDKALADLGYA